MSNWNYWKELPYHGEPPDNAPKNKKTKRNRNTKEIRRANIIWVSKFLLVSVGIFCVIYFATGRSLERTWGPALFFISIFLIPFGLSAGINAWNNYLQTGDLNKPQDADENEEEIMPKGDDKQSLAEDYLAQIKWRGEHPYAKIRPPEPDWKYKPTYSKNLSRLDIQVGIVLLFLLIVVAGVAIFQMVTTSHFEPGWLIIIILLLVFIFFVTRKQK